MNWPLIVESYQRISPLQGGWNLRVGRELEQGFPTSPNVSLVWLEQLGHASHKGGVLMPPRALAG